jgi:hypothetical protein
MRYVANIFLCVSGLHGDLLQTLAADSCCIMPAHGPANQLQTQSEPLATAVHKLTNSPYIS